MLNPIYRSLFALSLIGGAFAQDRVPLLSANDPASGWTFNNGQEFKGATGELTVDPAAVRDGKPSLRLHGDFTKGGLYVQAGSKINNVDIKELSMWVKNPGVDRFTLRLIDGSGQCHQLNLLTDSSDDWQHIVLPLEKFFARIGQSDAVQGIAKYESWGGAKDGKWHGPATSIYILLGASDEHKTRTLWLNDVTISPKTAEAPAPLVKTTLALDGIDGAAHDWTFTNGQEFPGAKGSFTVEDGKLKLAGDFTGGGAYVAAVKNLAGLEAKDISGFHLKYKSANAEFIRIQLVDGSGQTHQTRFKISDDDKWNGLDIIPAKVAGGEHWGGANDGKWHPSAKMISIALSDKSAPATKTPVLYLSEITADATKAAVIQAEAFKADFEKPLDWKIEGGVALDSQAAEGKSSLHFSRTENDARKPASAVSPAFKISPGNWQIALSVKTALTSPDSSYSGTVQLEALDAAGKPLEKITVADIYGNHPWEKISKTIELPQKAVTARFSAQLNKTWGSLWLDGVTASFLAPAAGEQNRVSRILFSTAQTGNLLLPGDSRSIGITVEASKPLPADQQEITCVVRDYWGSEQTAAIPVKLGPPEKKDAKFLYQASLDLNKAPLEIGRYYEIEATSAQTGGKAFSNHTSLAILPESPNKNYKPEEVPFTSRNWDNRITEFILLTDRMGIRTCGVWGGWSAKAPYKADVPQLDLVKKLGMAWLTGTPAATIEAGKRDYDETALRQGVRNLINDFGAYRPMIINLGNEPHGTGERVKANVEAYRVIYEEVKKIDPSIKVIATSVEPNEEYFKLGYGKYCDAFDFHIYETPGSIRKSIQQYRELQKKYDVVKPIYSTEIGLNSQGQTRQVVAVDVVKKSAAFFAEGGVSMAWFGFVYPDGEGKAHGSSGDSHNMFDCRFNRYCPRLDAISYFNIVNGIGIKKFIGEKSYDGGIHAFLFRDRDQKTLQILWSDRGISDVLLPLEGVGNVALTRIDGSTRELNAGKKSLTLSIGEDPILLTYEGGKELAGNLEPAASHWDKVPAELDLSKPVQFAITLGSGTELEKPSAGPLWKIEVSPSGNTRRLTAAPPAASKAREISFTTGLKEGNRVSGELYRRVKVLEK